MIHYDIEFKLKDSYDDDYIDSISNKKEAMKIARNLIKRYGDKLVKLDIKKMYYDGYTDLLEHIQII